MKSLLFIRSEKNNAFDGSVKGISVKLNGDILMTSKENQLNIKRGFIEVGSLPELEKTGTFTLKALVTMEQISGNRQDIMDSQVPPIALFIDEVGYLTGAVNMMAGGWKHVKSNTVLVAGKQNKIQFSRDAKGLMNLEIDGKNVGFNTFFGTLAPAGNKGIHIGTGVDGISNQFKGVIGDIQILDEAFTTEQWSDRVAKATDLETTIKNKLGPNVRVKVFPGLDESEARLQPIKEIMNAAGVEKISDLSTLKITSPITMTKGKVLVASRKDDSVNIDWKLLATKFKGLSLTDKKTQLAKYLTNRNSAPVLKTATSTIVNQPPIISTGFSTRFTGRIDSLSTSARTGVRITRETIAMSPTIEALRINSKLSDFIDLKKTELFVKDKEVFVNNLEGKTPSLWPGLGEIQKAFILRTIPINTSVIIAGTLDLTDSQIIIEPDVEKLYIIAEKVICGPSAKITWRMPGGSTPPRLDNPDLNGRGWSGVQTKPDSRDGLDGEDGLSGEAGINGAPGRNAPALEMWVKNLTNVPSIDLNGEDGILGGKGQKGGKGGNGGDGHVGHRYWFFGWHCDADPGDGGDGGNGGRGGNGGKGGNGGNGGNITIGVLDGTLAATITAGQFQWKNQGGHKGRGEQGGAGGMGGIGGRSGVGETCHDAEDGHDGSQGQPGNVGTDATSKGADAIDNFFEFTENAWDELLTRPYITEITPQDVFPGNTITIRGSRFANNDRVVIVGLPALVPVINADESISVIVPSNISGGAKSVFVLRVYDNTESNRIPIYIKPQLENLPAVLLPSTTVIISGKAFLANASVLIDGNAIPGTVNSAGDQITFEMVGTGGSGSSGGSVTVAVRNPDGLVSNTRTATKPRILEIPFKFGVNNLSFSNFTDGIPSWSTYEDTFGSAEVWHELLDPIFGHPILTAAYYFFYEYFLKGQANGGLATGFCTSLASLVADKLWKGETDAFTTTKGNIHKMLTAVHGKLLSRESLIHFHDQSRQEISRVELTARQIERTFLTGCDRNVAPLLFFIPSGAIWDSGYIDGLGSSHCLMPYRFVYPDNHPGPQLSADGLTTVSSLDGVKLYCWDCNHPSSANCRLEFRSVSGVVHFSYYPDGPLQFDSTNNITLGYWTNGDYLLSDHDLPFSGPFGLTSFIIDFLLSPADLEITDETGLRVGNFNNKIFSEMPDSHPCYLIRGAYLLPTGRNFTRRIVGNGVGKYSFSSIMPDGTTLKLEEVSTQPGHIDTLYVNADASQLRFIPHIEKEFTVVVSKFIDNQMRSLAISGIGGGPGTDIDITLAPDLSICRFGNRSTSKNVTVKAFSIDKLNNTPANNTSSIQLPSNHDLVVIIDDWNSANVNLEIVTF